MKHNNRIQQIKKLKNGGLSIKHEVFIEKDDENKGWVTNTTDCPFDYRSDFGKAMDKLKKHLMYTYHIGGLGLGKELSIMTANEQKAVKAISDKMEVEKIQIQWNEDDHYVTKVILVGKMDSVGKTVDLVTPLIDLTSDEYSHKGELQEIIDEVINYAENYVEGLGMVQMELNFSE